MKRLFRRRHRQKERSCSPHLNSPRASESSEAFPPLIEGSVIHHETNIQVRSGWEPREMQACLESPKGRMSLANRGERDIGADLALERPPANEQSEQFQVPLLNSTPEAREPTSLQVEPRASLKQAKHSTTPTPPLFLAPKGHVSEADTLTNLRHSHAQKCEDCELERPILWFCRACNLAFCNECWSKQLPHRKNKPGDVVHEKTNTEIAEKVKNVLTPPVDEMMCEKLHHDDEMTAWFGERFQSQCFVRVNVNTNIRIQ